jgi:SagB-type dehydrogenase family enzyme
MNEAMSWETILAYHEATKHHFHRYARSAGYMDWHNQPNPFRSYEGAVRVPLVFGRQDPVLPFNDLFTPAPDQGKELTLASLSSFLELSLGLSAWKAVGSSRWSLRINPSSGDLHPTEGHLVVPDLLDLKSGVYHYNPLGHALERRARLPAELASQMELHFGGPGFLVALSTIFWRESWKYGERAYRYCSLDTGHALAALAFAARLQGWELICLNAAGDREIGTVLGFDRTLWRPLEEEYPELIGWVSVRRLASEVPQSLPQHWVQTFAGIDFSGTPNALSHNTVDWSIIARTAAAAEKPITPSEPYDMDGLAEGLPAVADCPAATVIRQRRSAVSYDWTQTIAAETFWSILRNTLATADCAPFGVRLRPPQVHLVLFVHRVAGVAPGLYLLVRRAAMQAGLQSALRSTFQWRTVKAGWPLFLLEAGDVTVEAAELSCHQEIAGHGAFAVAMLAPFDQALKKAPYRYRQLFWECGMIGQALYLGAEAHGIRGTGIGCFFDDPVHELLGIRDRAFQSLYHFTVGHPIEDRRLTTLPAYHHLQRKFAPTVLAE